MAQTSDPARYIVWTPRLPGWRLGSVADTECNTGGHRTLHELAVAIAATGRRVEMRGHVDLAELQRLSAAAAAGPELPSEPARPGRGDVVIMAEGSPYPLEFAYVALSGARTILLLLAPTGLFGWPFIEGWSRPDPTSVAIASLARPEHFRAMAAMGFELWTHMPRLASLVAEAGLSCSFIGHGRPMPYPAPGPKRYDVVTLANNRWTELAREVASRLDGSVMYNEIPPGSNAEMLRAFGQARILIHPMRIEGTSRIGLEARAMGAVPVLLDSNPFRVGMDEEAGAVVVGSLDEMPAAVMSLLSDEPRLDALRARGMETARTQVDWDAYVGRVDAALSGPVALDAGREARAVIGDSLMREEDRILERARAAEDRAARLAHQRDGLSAELRAAKAELAVTREYIRSVQGTRAWRSARAYWRSRERAQRIGLARFSALRDPGGLTGEVPPPEREDRRDQG